jgi:Cu+-exporting ATPase
VLAYSASDYWRSAWLSVRQRVLTLDVPIALGLAALYAQSAWEIASGRGAGYLDSLVGLVFFLLCGRAFQRKTQERIVFDRDYKCFFPLAANRRVSMAGRPVPTAPAKGEDHRQRGKAARWDDEPYQFETISISGLCVGDRLLVRNGELIPADARLVSGAGQIDYSFVTGEAEPVSRKPGDHLYAGGKQIGATIEVETVKPVSQSYLTSLWDHEAFRKERQDGLNTLTNRYSRRFTALVITVAIAAALFWFFAGDAARGLKAFISVLIVACPCALALAAPFTLGTAQRLLDRMQVFLKNALVLERLAGVDSIVFDKTGTLTADTLGDVSFRGGPSLSASELLAVFSLTRNSTHPHSVAIAASTANGANPFPVQSYAETPGYGVEGFVSGQSLRLGSRAWLAAGGVSLEAAPDASAGASHLAIDGVYRGTFHLANPVRPETAQAIENLSRSCDLALLSGDNDKQAERFRGLFGPRATLRFDQSPMDKLAFIQRLQEDGKTVMMVGDGLNDAGALKQSDVGVAVVETSGAFSPASDVILEGKQVPALHRVLALARRATRIVRLSFAISAAYNLVGIGIAAAGLLSPLICAVLMPLSSISVVLFACGATTWAARKEGFV